MGDALGYRDLRSHILSLPTKSDQRVEKAMQQDIKTLQVDTAHIEGRVEALESKWMIISKIGVSKLTSTLEAYLRLLHLGT